MHSPNLKHWLAARGVLEYLKETSSYGITFQTGSGSEMVVYADSAYGTKITRRWSGLSLAEFWCVSVPGHPIDF